MADDQEANTPSVILSQKRWLPSRKILILGIIVLTLAILFFLKFGGNFPSQSQLINQQAKMLQVTQNLNAEAAIKKAKETIAKQEKIQKDAQKRGITVTQDEIDKAAQKIISQSSKQTVMATLQSYGWTETDWKAKIANDLLAEKLQKSNLSWKDYQYLAIRWDNHSKEQFASEDKAWEMAKPILEKARVMLDKKQDIASVAAELNKDPKITKYFVVQPLANIQRIYSDTKIASDPLKRAILSTPANSLSQPIRVFGFGVVIKTFEGSENQKSSSGQIFNKSSFNFPAIVETAYATHQDVTSCADLGGQQYCAAGDYCYYEGVIAGYVRDTAGNPISGATVTANYPGSKDPGCLCTDTSGSVTSGGDGGYNIHGLCCYNNPFNVTASKSGYSCNNYPVEISNGTTIVQNIYCTPPAPLTCAQGNCSACSSKTSVCGVSVSPIYDTCQDNLGRLDSNSAFCTGGASLFRCYASQNSQCNSSPPGSYNYSCSICPQPTYTIGGRITNSSTLAGISGVTVNQGVTNPPSCNIGTATTDSTGNYRFNNVSYNLSFCLRPPSVSGYTGPSPTSFESLTATADNTGYNFTYTPILAPTIFADNCTGAPNPGQINQNITWNVSNVSGGTGTYTYSWSGDDGLSSTTSNTTSTSNSVNKTYTTVGTGTKNATITISSGTSTPITKTCSITITPFNYSLTNGGDKSVTQGSSVSNSVAVTLTQGTTQNVSLSVSTCPAGVSCSLVASLGTPSYSTTLNMTATSATTGTPLPVTITGTSSGLANKTTTFNLTVNPTGTPPAPTVSTIPACINAGYTGSGVTINWSSVTNPGVTWVNIDSDSGFAPPYYHKCVNTSCGASSTTTSTTGPSGFNANDGPGALSLNPAINYFVRTFNGTQHSNIASFNILACSLAPTVTLSASPTSITSGNSTNLSWTITGSPTSCTVGTSGTPTITLGDWSSISGGEITNGTHANGRTITMTSTTSASKAFSIFCTNSSGNSPTTTATVTVNPVGTPAAPTVSIPACISSGYTGSGVTINWSNLGVTWVNIDSDSGFATPYYQKAVSAVTSTTGPSGFNANDGSGALSLNPTTNYFVRTFNGTQHSNIASFNILACSLAPTVDLKTNDSDGPITIPNNTSTLLTWATTNNPVSCIASGAWSGSKTTSGGSELTGVLTGPNTFTYALACANASGSEIGANSVTVNVNSPPPSSGTPWIQTIDGDVHSNTGIVIQD